ncbi:hypothetical protein B0T16DRAFT_395747 [Cercophora newfieldiana]|uniref:Uncharacterized protein n=1 Tax=Cercophora newfieldiana TaxID=92897 RepID=A0AA39YPG5_9PEZI|nr:hypothetical protein B0T16DRAFT_395747 [Cercophora newfieldiana]
MPSPPVAPTAAVYRNQSPPQCRPSTGSAPLSYPWGESALVTDKERSSAHAQVPWSDPGWFSRPSTASRTDPLAGLSTSPRPTMVPTPIYPMTQPVSPSTPKSASGCTTRANPLSPSSSTGATTSFACSR